jgi:GT2 family glycosyltransferase
MAGDSSVAVIAVAYNSFDVIPGMVASLPAGVRLQLVDNGPDDGLRGWAAARDIPLLVPGLNMGFGAGCNLGAEAVPEAAFYFFLNPDARLGPGAIDALLAAAARYPEASAFGPQIRKPSGEPVSLRPSTLLKRAPGQRRKRFPQEDTRVPSLSGAALFVRADAFRQVGGFDPAIFMYFEDDDLTIRLAREAGPLYYIPAARVLHEGGGSTPSSPELTRLKGYHYARSQIYMYRKLGRRAPFLSGLASALRRCLSLRLWLPDGRRSRHYALGRLQGSWSMRR